MWVKTQQSQTLIQQNIIIYDTTINTHCSWSTSINTSDFCTIPALRQAPYLHTHLIAHAFLTVHHRRQDTVCLRSIHQNTNQKNDSCFWSKPREGQNTLAVVTESSQKNTEGGRKSRVIVTLPTESVCLYFIQDDRKVDVDSWVIQLNDSLLT